MSDETDPGAQVARFAGRKFKNEPDAASRVELWTACQRGDEEAVRDVLARLKDEGTSFKGVWVFRGQAHAWPDMAGVVSPLHIAAANNFGGVVRQLLAAKVPVNGTQKWVCTFGNASARLRTALDTALMSGSTEVVCTLLEARATVAPTNLWFACLAPSHVDTYVALLLAAKCTLGDFPTAAQFPFSRRRTTRADFEAAAIRMLRAFHVPDARDGVDGAAPLLLDALMRAASHGLPRVAAALLDAKASANGVGRRLATGLCTTPLLFATRVRVFSKHHLDVVRLLLAAKASAREQSVHGANTPLRCALQHKNADAVALLLAHGAVADDSAFTLAALASGACVRVLLQAKAWPVCVDNILYAAVCCASSLKLLLHVGLRPGCPDKLWYVACGGDATLSKGTPVPEARRLLTAAGICMTNTVPVLTWACMRNDTDIVRWLLEAKANPDGPKPHPAPLVQACHRAVGTCNAAANDIIAQLLAAKASPEPRNNTVGLTRRYHVPLHQVAATGNVDAVRRLLAAKADARKPAGDNAHRGPGTYGAMAEYCGHTPLCAALTAQTHIKPRGDFIDVVNLLLAAKADAISPRCRASATRKYLQKHLAKKLPEKP